MSEHFPFSVDIFLNEKLSRCKMFAPRLCISVCSKNVNGCNFMRGRSWSHSPETVMVSEKFKKKR